MADAPAAFGLEQLKKLDEMNSMRIKNAEYLIDNLKPYEKYIQLPQKGTENFVHTYYSFAILIKEEAGFFRKDLVHYLESHGIETRAIMCGTLSDQPSLCNAPGRDYGELKVSRYIRDNGFFVGCHPGLGKEQLQHVIKTIGNYILENTK